MADAIERRAGLGDRIGLAVDVATDAPAEKVKLPVKDGPDVAFTGWEIASYSTNSDRPRWAELRLWQTVDGNAVAGRAWHSSIPGESTFWTAAKVDTIEDAMDIWGWDTVAKAFARKLKWDVTRRIA